MEIETIVRLIEALEAAADIDTASKFEFEIEMHTAYETARHFDSAVMVFDPEGGRPWAVAEIKIGHGTLRLYAAVPEVVA